MFASLGLDPEDVVANFHKGEHVHLGGDGGLLCFCEVELRVCKGCQGFKKRLHKSVDVALTFTALLLRDVASVLQIVESKDVLHLSFSVDDRAGAILDTRFDLLTQELL